MANEKIARWLPLAWIPQWDETTMARTYILEPRVANLMKQKPLWNSNRGCTQIGGERRCYRLGKVNVTLFVRRTFLFRLLQFRLGVPESTNRVRLNQRPLLLRIVSTTFAVFHQVASIFQIFSWNNALVTFWNKFLLNVELFTSLCGGLLCIV